MTLRNRFFGKDGLLGQRNEGWSETLAKTQAQYGSEAVEIAFGPSDTPKLVRADFGFDLKNQLFRLENQKIDGLVNFIFDYFTHNSLFFAHFRLIEAILVSFYINFDKSLLIFRYFDFVYDLWLAQN